MMAYAEAGAANRKADLASLASCVRAAFGADKNGFKDFLRSLED